MKVKPEDLALALKMLEMIPAGSVRKFAWNGLHRLESTPEHLVMKTTDGTTWIQWHVPIEGPALPLGVNIDRARLSHLKQMLQGGRFTLSQNVENKVLGLQRGENLNIRIPYEQSSAAYPVPPEVQKPVTWRFRSDTLAKALAFATPFILEKGNAELSCATIGADGTLVTGNPQTLIVLRGVFPTRQTDGPSDDYFSIKSLGAKIAAGFLSQVGPVVDVDLSTSGQGSLVLRDPASGNLLVLPATPGRFRLEKVERSWTEQSRVDKKSVLVPARTFSGVSSPDVSAWLVLEFKGYDDLASLMVRTQENDETRRCSYESSIHRTVHGEKPPVMKAVAIKSDLLTQAMASMSGHSVVFDIGDRMLSISNEDTDVAWSVILPLGKQNQEGSAGSTDKSTRSEGRTLQVEHVEAVPAQQKAKAKEKASS